MRILFVLNPIAGGGRTAKRVAADIQATFRDSDLVYDTVLTQKKGDGTFLAKDAVREGYDVVVAVGGDGTINEIATGLVGSTTALGIIPQGSGNGFARSLGIPLMNREACQIILQGIRRTIDVGQVGDRYFFSTSGIGFDAYIGKYYNEKAVYFRGMLPYFQFATTEYFKYTPQEVTLTCHGETFTYTPFILTVANVEQYGGGAIIAPGAVPDDGLFDISVILQCHTLDILFHLPKLFAGTLKDAPQFITHKASSLTITRKSPSPIHVDGEPCSAGEVLEYTLLPHALDVIVPVEKEKSEQKASTTAKQHHATSPTPSGSIVEKLEKLAELRDKGVISEKEFKHQKQKLLDQL